jgi:hypothetical protein
MQALHSNICCSTLPMLLLLALLMLLQQQLEITATACSNQLT